MLWGMNGSGKTTLLKILHSALLGDATQILRMDFDSAEVVVSTNSGIETRTITAASMEELDRVRNVSRTHIYNDRTFEQMRLYREAEALTWASTRGDIRAIPHRYLPISRLSDASSVRGERAPSAIKEILDESEFDRLFAWHIQRTWEQHQLSAERRVRVAQQNSITEILRTVLDPTTDVPPTPAGFSSGDAEQLLMSFFEGQAGFRHTVRQLDIAGQFQSNEQFQRVVATVLAIQGRLKAAEEPEQRFIESVDSVLGPRKRLNTAERRLMVSSTKSIGGASIPLEALSSGEKQILRILLETLVAGDSPVIVDEPELSLHVDWQARLLTAMRFVNPEAQIIVASHAPEIVGDRSASRVSEV